MDKRLKRILPRVQKPARYTGGEYNQILKNRDEVDLRLAFCFPDTYEVGMSHLGLKILYGLINREAWSLCERVFMPWTDMMALMVSCIVRTTTTAMKGKFSSFLCALAGYPMPISVAWLAVWLLQQGVDVGLIVGLSVLFFVMLLFWIRNAYGVVWVLLFIAINVGLIYLNNPLWIRYAALFYVVMIVVESVVSVLTLFYLSVRTPDHAGDATNLDRLTHVPAFLWSLLFIAYVAFVIWRMVITITC